MPGGVFSLLPSATPKTRFFYSGSFPAVFRIKVESVVTSGRKVRLQKKEVDT